MRHGDTEPETRYIDPRGPVFLSYRYSDGAQLAENIAWALRAAGVPVWHDQTDLPPGDTQRRLVEAMRTGLSGAVLIVTPDIEKSEIIREIELPSLLGMSDDSRFAFSVALAIDASDSRLDYDAPDRLLQRPDRILKNYRQNSALTAEDIATIAHDHSRRRVEALRTDIESRGDFIEMDVQTRLDPAASINRHHLVVRFRPPSPGDRRPNREGLEDLQHFLGSLPRLLNIAGAGKVKISGGAHLTVAFALGAAIPTTLFGHVEAIDTYKNAWIHDSRRPSAVQSNPLLNVTERAATVEASGETAVYLDLVPERNDVSFDQFLGSQIDRFAQVFHIRPVGEGFLDPADSDVIISEASSVIRRAAALSPKSELHLLLRCPWTVALLLGRTLNTVRVHLYEWEDGPDDHGNPVAPRYLPSIVVRSGAGGSPIEEVVLPRRPEMKAPAAQGG